MRAARGSHVLAGSTRHHTSARRGLIAALAALLVLGQLLATSSGVLAAPRPGVVGTVAVDGLDGLVVDQAGAVQLQLTADERTDPATPLRAVVRITDESGRPLNDVGVSIDGIAVDVDGDGRVVLPTMDQPPLTVATHPELVDDAGLSLTLHLRAPDTATRYLTARLVESNEHAAEVVRRAGPDRIATAVAVSAGAFPGGADTVWVARADEFADALSAGPAAGLAGGPILLTAGDALPDATATELARLTPTRVVVLGGTAAVADPVLDQITAAVPGAEVVRVAGPDRFATAAAVATDTFTAPVPIVVVATGSSFADALSGGAAAGHHGGPLLLVDRDTVPEATAAALRALQPARIVVLGGTAAISDVVAGQLAAFAPGGVARHAGPDRYSTSAAVVAAMFDPADVDAVFVATGDGFPDALSGTPAAVRSGGPLMLVGHDTIPTPVAEQLDRLDVGTATVLGGPAAVGDGVAQHLGRIVRDIAPDPDRFRDAAVTPAMPFAARDAVDPGGPGGGGGGGAAPVVVDSPTPGAPLNLRPGDRFPVRFTTSTPGTYVIEYRAAGDSTWLPFPNGTATGSVGTGPQVVQLNAPLAQGVLDLRVTLLPATRAAGPGPTQRAGATSVVLPAVVTVALTFPPPLISALVEDVADQSQLIAVRPVGGLADGVRLDIDLSSAERGGADYPLDAEVTLLNGNGTATLVVVRDRTARIEYTAGPGDSVPAPGVSPLLTFRIDHIATANVHETHVGQFFRYDIMHGVQRVFAIGSGPSIASPTASDVAAGSGHTFQLLSFAMREPLAPYERVDIDLSEAEQTVIDYADAFVALQGDGGHGAAPNHGPPPPPPGSVFIDVDHDERAVVTFIAGPDGIPTVQPEGPTLTVFVGGIVVADTVATTPVDFVRLATGEVATTTFTTQRRDVVGLSASDLAAATPGQVQTITMTLDGDMEAGGGLQVELPRTSQVDYSDINAVVVDGNGTVFPYTYDGITVLAYDSAGDTDGATITFAIEGVDTGPDDSSHVVRAHRYDGVISRSAIFSVGAGSALAGLTVTDLPDDATDLYQSMSFLLTDDLAEGDTVTIDLSAAEAGLVAYDGALTDSYAFGGADPGTTSLVTVDGVSAVLTWTAGPGGLPSGSEVYVNAYGHRTDAGTDTYDVPFTLGDGRTASTSFAVRPQAGFDAISATSLESGVNGQAQTLRAVIRGALGPNESISISLSGAERGGGRYGGATTRVTSPGGGTSSMFVWVGEYADVTYTAPEGGLADGSEIVIEVDGVNTDAVDETHLTEWYRYDSGGYGRALFDIGAGSDFVGVPYLSNLGVNQSDQYQFGTFGLVAPLGPGETVTFDLSAAQAAGVDYSAAFEDYLYPSGTVDVEVVGAEATLTYTADPEGLEAGEPVYFEVFGISTDTRTGTHSVPVTAPAASTTITFQVVPGHGFGG